MHDFTICDGDFFNHNREWAFSHLNEQETHYGDYADGICRYRKMYSFPSPLRTVRGISLISKFDHAERFNSHIRLAEPLERVDREDRVHRFYVYRDTRYRNCERNRIHK